jgi:glyoxylase-like metal-dependent hydrolase (beta-lactamase superfamily II)
MDTPLSIKKAVVGSFQENCWLIVNQKSGESVILDPGDSVQAVEKMIADSDSEPLAILNTHGHLDHIGAVCKLKEKFDIPFYLHPEDESLVRDYPSHAEMFGVPCHGVPDIDDFLADGETLHLADLEITVLHTPGHSPGSSSFLIDNHVFVGDALFAGSVGRVDLPGGNYETLMHSIDEKLLSLPDDTVVHSGHGPDTTIGQERRNNPFIIEWHGSQN